MKDNSRKFNFLAAWLTVVAVSMGLHAQIVRPLEKPRKIDSKTRYAIVGNWLDDEKAQLTASRHVEILIDEKDFSEANLRSILGLVSKRFPSPKLLFVDVSTSLDQILTPEERDEGVTSDMDGPPVKQHLWAIYVRSTEGEYFRYSPLDDRSGNKRVQLTVPRK